MRLLKTLIGSPAGRALTGISYPEVVRASVHAPQQTAGTKCDLHTASQCVKLASALVQAARQRRRSLAVSNGDTSAFAITAGATAGATSGAAEQQAGNVKPAGKKNWLKHRLFNMSKGSLKNMDDDESDATSRASSAADLQVAFFCAAFQPPPNLLGLDQHPILPKYLAEESAFAAPSRCLSVSALDVSFHCAACMTPFTGAAQHQLPCSSHSIESRWTCCCSYPSSSYCSVPRASFVAFHALLSHCMYFFCCVLCTSSFA